MNILQRVQTVLAKAPEPIDSAIRNASLAGPNGRALAAVESFLTSEGAPKHALLIDGPWGVGKTYFHNAIRLHFGGGRRWLYVSLYGVTKKADLDDAVFAAAYPILTGKAAAVGGAIGGAVLKHLRAEVKIRPRDLLNLDAIDVIVFDDLERSRLLPTELLGYINNYVEHGPAKLKVLLLANLEAMSDKGEFEKTREKVVGRTVKLSPDIGAALPHFVSSLSDIAARSLIQEAMPQLQALFQQSGLANLRLLHQAVWELSRVLAVTEERHQANAELMKSLIDLVIVFGLELRSQGIEAIDLEDRRAKWIKGTSTGGDPTAIRRISEKYPGTSLIETPLSDTSFQTLFVDGVVNADHVRIDLDRSRWFVTEEQPAWRIVWRSHELPDELVEPAIDKMNSLYDARAYTATGEILHVLGIRLWLANIGRLDMDRQAVQASGVTYIDDVFAGDALEAYREDRFGRLSSYAGLGYMEAKSKEFVALAAHLEQRRRETSLLRLPSEAEALLEELKSDAELFARRILHNGGEDSRWSDTAVLHFIDPAALASWMAEQHPAVQRDIVISLSVRYDHGALDGRLAPEREWLERLRDHLFAEAAKLRAVGKDRLENIVKWYLTPILEPPKTED